MRKYRHFDQAFKDMVIDQYLEGAAFSVLANRHDISPTLVRFWAIKRLGPELIKPADFMTPAQRIQKYQDEIDDLRMRYNLEPTA